MQLSDHFSLAELTASQEAVRHNIDNVPSDQVLANLRTTAEGLELVRAMLAKPIIISSGYRSEELNHALGGVTSSAHCRGFAADFISPAAGTPYQIACRILSNDRIKFDQLICEGDWVHISFAPPLRRQVLTATFKQGVASYAPGLRGMG
jgi:zinc D-Ala-D-Ala carboxypeptidase